MGWVVNATSRPFYPRESDPGTSSVGGWVGPRSGSGQERKTSPPTGIRSADRPTCSESLYRLISLLHVVKTGRGKCDQNSSIDWWKQGIKTQFYMLTELSGTTPSCGLVAMFVHIGLGHFILMSVWYLTRCHVTKFACQHACHWVAASLRT